MDNPKISVITVSYNCVDTIEATILSVINQAYSNVEYIIIDGKSTDGTVDIIKKYQDKIAYWISEPDDGIYEAMNKGIDKVTGEWINFMNSGDVFSSTKVLSSVFDNADYSGVDVIYGDSTEVENNCQIEIRADGEIGSLTHHSIYRHGASFVSSSTHKLFKFDTKLKHKLGFSLDFNCIHQLYKANKKFKKVDINIMTYLKDGVSNQPVKSIWYNYLITKKKSKYNIEYFETCFKIFITYLLSQKTISYIFHIVYDFWGNYISNNIINHIPIWAIRRLYYKIFRMKIGNKTEINMSVVMWKLHKIKVGNNSHINRDCFLDARAGITIGSNVSISHRVNIVTGSHNPNSKHFEGIFRPVIIEDYVWIGIGATILQGVKIGKGAVVAAGSVVAKDIPPFMIVGGVPSKKISMRNSELDYVCLGIGPFS